MAKDVLVMFFFFYSVLCSFEKWQSLRVFKIEFQSDEAVFKIKSSHCEKNKSVEE